MSSLDAVLGRHGEGERSNLSDVGRSHKKHRQANRKPPRHFGDPIKPDRIAREVDGGARRIHRSHNEARNRSSLQMRGPVLRRSSSDPKNASIVSGYVDALPWGKTNRVSAKPVRSFFSCDHARNVSQVMPSDTVQVVVMMIVAKQDEFDVAH